MSATREYLGGMNLSSEMASFSSPAEKPDLGPTIKVGDHFPDSDQLPQLRNLGDKPTLVTFLRHCGCPFAEKAFQQFRHLSDENQDVDFIAISHSNKEDTDEWLVSVGGTGDVEVVVDPERTLYAKYGLGFSSYWANMGPMTFWKTLKLGTNEMIYNRPTKSGYRWQTAGSFAIDVDGTVRWTYVSRNAPDVPQFEEGLNALGKGAEARKKAKQAEKEAKKKARTGLPKVDELEWKKTETGKTEPAKTEAANAEPANTEPAKTEPVQTKIAKPEPAKVHFSNDEEEPDPRFTV